MKKAFFLDRDGVINKDHGYVHTWDKFEIIERTYEALQLIKGRGYLIVVITNQAGIAKGYYSESDFEQLMSKFRTEAASKGIEIDGIYHCPHHPEGVIQGLGIKCECRKPKPGMIKKAAEELNIDLEESYLVGDKLSDIQAGLACNIKESFLIDCHPNELVKNFPNLYYAVKFALGS